MVFRAYVLKPDAQSKCLAPWLLQDIRRLGLHPLPAPSVTSTLLIYFQALVFRSGQISQHDHGPASAASARDGDDAGADDRKKDYHEDEDEDEDEAAAVAAATATAGPYMLGSLL